MSAWLLVPTTLKDYLVIFSLPFLLPTPPHPTSLSLHTHPPFSPIIPIPEVLHHHYENTIRTKELLPYLAIIHVRDMLIPLSERSGFSCFKSGAPLHSGGCSRVVWSHSVATRVHRQLNTLLVAPSEPLKANGITQ